MWDETYILSGLPPEAETAEEVEFILDVLKLRQGATVLDLCCGEGRHGHLLAAAGLTVIGVDSSRFLLEAARETERSMQLIEADMRTIPLKAACDAVINLFTSFGFFDEADNRKVLAEIASVLKPGGRLLLEYWNPYVASQLDGTRNWWWVSESTLVLAEVEYRPESGELFDHRTVVADLKFDESDKTLPLDCQIQRNGVDLAIPAEQKRPSGFIPAPELPMATIRQTVHRVRFYFPTELDAMLAEVGLTVCARYGDFDHSPFSMEARRMITIVERSF